VPHPEEVKLRFTCLCRSMGFPVFQVFEPGDDTLPVVLGAQRLTRRLIIQRRDPAAQYLQVILAAGTPVLRDDQRGRVEGD
jgi:hypothetical protein